MAPGAPQRLLTGRKRSVSTAQGHGRVYLLARMLETDKRRAEKIYTF